MAADQERHTGDPEEEAGLLHQTLSADDQPADGDLASRTAEADQDSGSDTPITDAKRAPWRQSSLAQPRPNGAPRTSQRVRFDVSEIHTADRSNGHARGPQADDWMEEEDYMDSPGSYDGSQRAPLLTDHEAPSVALANTIDFNPEDHLEAARPKSGIRSAFMNMANSIIGAGIIGQPYAFKQAGLLTGLLLLVALTITVDWTIRLIVTNSKLSGADSFQATMHKCFGKGGLIAISIAQWAFAFGGMIAFCIIIGDTIPQVIAAAFPSLATTHVLWLLTDRRAMIVLFVFGISYPLSLYRDIAMLAKASSLALVSMLIIIVAVLTQGPIQPADVRGQLRGGLLIGDGVFQAIGVISFAFVCHHNSLLIYGSLKTPTMDRFAKVTHYSTSISMLACMAMALGGYLCFGNLTQGNVLNNFPRDNVFVNIARLCFGLNMLTTLPLECFVCREVMTEYFFPGAPYQRQRHMLLTTGLVAGAVAVSLALCDLGVVFELVGATSACALAYILPPLCYLRLTRRRSWETVAAYACVAFGAGVMLVSLALAVRRIVTGQAGGGTCS